MFGLGGAVVGALVGSFLATLVLRWPRGQSVVAGRSRCDHCGARLRWHDLVPVASHLWLRGRCARCDGGIDARHLWIELACILTGAAALTLRPDAAGAAGALFGWGLVALAALDLGHFWLPDRLTLPLLGLGLVGGSLGLDPPFADRLAGALAGFGFLALVAIAYRRLRGREGLGGGDAKLFGAIGAWLGWAALPTVMMAAALLGLAAVLVMRLRGRAVSGSDALPLGALLAAAAWPVWLAASIR